MDIEKFKDGTSIEWFSRESLLYRDDAYTVQVEYDIYKTGIFKSGRKILCDSIKQWEEYPKDSLSEIDAKTKKDIINKAKEYFEKRNIEVELS